jgi:hypothetical protein
MNQNSAPNLILVKTALDKLIDQAMLGNARVGKAEATDPVVFTQDTATNAGVSTSVIGGGGYFDKTTDDLSPKKDATVTAAALRFTPIALFSKDLPITRTFMADQQQSAVAKAVAQQTKTWLATRDRNAAQVYSLGFTTQTTVDGVALFSNVHVNQNGETVDNLETVTLSDSGLNTVVNSLRQQQTQIGVKLGYDPDFLFVPSILHSTGTQITKSILRAGAGNNDLNYWSEVYPGMKCVYSPFLDDTSTTAYFVGAQGHGVIRFEREAFFTELIDWKTDPQDQYKYKMRAREEVDSIEYSGLVGSNGTTS